MDSAKLISTLSRSGAPTPGGIFFCNSVGKVSRFGLFKSVKKFSFRLFSNSLRRGMNAGRKSGFYAICAAVRHFAKNQTEKLSQYLQVDGYFNAELERKVRIFTLCMVADCPHRICGQNGIPKFPQIGAELPAKSGNAKGRKSSDINRMKVPVVRCNMLSSSS